MRWRQRLRVLAPPVLFATVAVLLVANLFKLGFSLDAVAANKDAISALSSLVSIAGFTVAGILAYFRFFRGRTFVARASVGLEVTVTKGPRDELWHSILLSVENVGAVTLWTPVLSLIATARYVSGDATVTSIDKWWKPAEGRLKESETLVAIDSGVKASLGCTPSMSG